MYICPVLTKYRASSKIPVFARYLWKIPVIGSNLHINLKFDIP